MNESSQEPIGTKVTEIIEESMSRNHTNPNTPLMELFASSAFDVAFSQYQQQGRGIIFGSLNPNKKFLYVRQPDTSTALWMASIEMKRDVASVVQSYNPVLEAVLVMLVPQQVQLFLIQPNGAMKMIATGAIELTPISFPPQISFRKEQEGDNVYYVFTHSQLGKLGRIVVKHHSSGQTEIKYEIVNPADSPSTKKRVEIFYPLAMELINRMEMGLAR